MSGELRLDGVTFARGLRPVLAGLEATIAAGERVAVVGRSGAGKTTLLRLIAGLEQPAQGRIELGGRPVSEPGRVLVAPRERRVGFVFQGLALWDHMSVAQTLSFAGGGEALPLAGRVGLGDRLDARPHQLSGGERQRLALARALATSPDLLLLDEPFAHLDEPLRVELSAMLLALAAERGLTVILVTHQASDALELAERGLVLEGGRFVEDLRLDAELAPRRRVTCELLGLRNLVEGEIRGGQLHTAIGPLDLVGAPAAGPGTAFVSPAQVRVLPDDEGPGRALRWAIPSPGGLTPVAVALDGCTPPLRGFAAEALPVGQGVRVVVTGPVRLLEA